METDRQCVQFPTGAAVSPDRSAIEVTLEKVFSRQPFVFRPMNGWAENEWPQRSNVPIHPKPGRIKQMRLRRKCLKKRRPCCLDAQVFFHAFAQVSVKLNHQTCCTLVFVHPQGRSKHFARRHRLLVPGEPFLQRCPQRFALAHAVQVPENVGWLK